MTTTATSLTVDDLDHIPEEQEGDRHELIDGELVVTPVPTTEHQDSSFNLTLALGNFVRSHQLGKVYTAPTGVRLSSDTFVVPDICFVARERLDIIEPKGINGAPDLIVEILSPSTRRRDLVTKRELYARFKVPEYWIVDPKARTVTVLILAQGGYGITPAGEGGVVRSRVLPDLKLTLDQVFADM